MLIAKVVGSVVATQKEVSLVGKKLMIIQPMKSTGEFIGAEEIAVDDVGAGVGENVIVTKGGSARYLYGGNSTIDSAIFGIIDSFEK